MMPPTINILMKDIIMNRKMDDEKRYTLQELVDNSIKTGRTIDEWVIMEMALQGMRRSAKSNPVPPETLGGK